MGNPLLEQVWGQETLLDTVMRYHHVCDTCPLLASGNH